MDEVVLASERIREKAHNELSFVQRNADITLVLAGVVGIVVALVIWRQKERKPKDSRAA